MQFISVFGRNQLLSLLETASYLKAREASFSIKAFSNNAAILEIESFNAKQTIRELGGTIKIAEVKAEAGIKGNDFKELEEKISKIDFTAEFGKKFYYTINDYSEKLNEELLDFLAGYFKQCFKSQKLKAMLKWPKQVEGERKKSIAPKILAKRLDKEHLDLCYFAKEGKVFFGKTIAVSNPAEFIERDTERPVQKHELQTSPRLARILTNLAGVEKGKTILDTFCGIGSIMQEIMLAGYNSLGIDANAENARDCEKNLEWLKKKYNLKQEFKVLNQDSRRLSSFLRTGEFQAVVTEPYLGPYLRKLPSIQQAERTARELEQLYGAVFKELAKLLQSGERVVFILPQVPTIQGRKVKVQESVFSNNGFKIFNTLDKELPNFLPYLYKDSESRIERLIYVLVKE